MNNLICTFIPDPLAKYNSMVRPVVNYSHPMDVEMSLTLLQIIELNEREQYLTTSMMYNFVGIFILQSSRPNANIPN